MKIVTIGAAKNRLAQLIDDVCAGEEVVITRGGRPVAELVPLNTRPRRRFGALRGVISTDASLFDPLPERELCGWER